MEEPSLLDYLKEKLSLRRILRGESSRIVLPEKEAVAEDYSEEVTIALKSALQARSAFPWRSLLAVLLAVLGQSRLEPPSQNAVLGIVFYVLAGGFLVWALLIKEWQVSEPKKDLAGSIGLEVRTLPLIVFVILFLLAFLTFTNNRFSLINVSLWVAALVAGLAAFWEPGRRPEGRRILDFFKKKSVVIKVDWWSILVAAVFCLCAWFHLYQLKSVPLNMTSDHAEKLLDINRVLNGQASIFFTNNGGREPIQFYLAALLVKVFHFGLDFFTLKLTMALAFLLSLIYVYRLGREVGTRWTGLIFMALMGFSSWMNMIARVGLRVVLTPVFIAPVLFYLFRGLRTKRRNDFILAGILTGLGLLGYSAFRLVPFLVALGVVIYLAYHKFSKEKAPIWSALGLIVLFALTAALPLFRFALDFPQALGYRTLTRMTSAEVQIDGNVAAIFFDNLWKCLVMPFWKDGNTWVISVPYRPALDVVSAAFYLLGLALVAWRWLRSRSWQDLFLLISIPVLMLPSVLALAFPDENPSLSRAGGAAVPILLVCAIGMESLLTSLWQKCGKTGTRVLVGILGAALIGFSASQNFDIALKQYPEEYLQNTWNSAQMAEVVKGFIDDTGSADNVWVVGVPYWVDTRLVAISAGYIDRDYAIWVADLDKTLASAGPKLFIVKYNDTTGMEALKELYPDGFAVRHSNAIPDRDFYAYFVMEK